MPIRLSASDLNSFRIVALERNISRAAARLYITQSALSRRIQSIEDKLGATLFVRNHQGAELTEVGHRLHDYAEQLREQEEEFFAHVGAMRGDRTLGGRLRVVAHPAMGRSLALPAMAPLLRANPSLMFDLGIESGERPHMALVDRRCDIALSFTASERATVQNHRLGTARLVVIESAEHRTRDTALVEGDSEMRLSDEFFVAQLGEPPTRSLSTVPRDLEAVLHAVELGLGRAVMPVHAVQARRRVRCIADFGVQELPVYAHTYAQTGTTTLVSQALDRLRDGARDCLARDPAGLLLGVTSGAIAAVPLSGGGARGDEACDATRVSAIA